MMKKLSYLNSQYAEPYGYCLDKERNIHAEKNLKALNYYDKKIACSQKEKAFVKSGHYIFDYVPMIYSREDWFDSTLEKQNGFCDLIITDMISKKKVSNSLQLDTLYVNKRYLHGISKHGNKRLGGVAFLIDNCLYTYDKLKEKNIFEHKELKASHVPSLPFIDSELTYQRAKRNKNRKFFDVEPLNTQKDILDLTRERINAENRYVYGIFKIEENWLIPMEDGGIEEVYVSKFIVVQALSENWLEENNFPADTPIVAQSGDSNSDRTGFTNGQYGMTGQDVISTHEATLVGLLDRERGGYFIVPKGNDGSGRIYQFNEKPKWGKNDPRPHCCVNGYPLFSSDFSFRRTFQRKSVH